jgi:hypothetical protein
MHQVLRVGLAARFLPREEQKARRMVIQPALPFSLDRRFIHSTALRDSQVKATPAGWFV